MAKLAGGTWCLDAGGGGGGVIIQIFVLCTT